MGSLIGTYHLAVHGDPVAFEAAMTDVIMPSVEVWSRGVRGFTQYLEKLYREYGAPQYRWSVTLDHFGNDASEQVGDAIPDYFADIAGQAADGLAPFAVVVGFAMTIPVSARP